MATRKLMLVLTIVLLASCSGDDGENGRNGQNGAQGPAGDNGVPGLVSVDDVVTTNANIAYSVYSDSVIQAKALRTALQTLVSSPSDATLQAAKSAWLESREPYSQTEIYRFRAGPIDALKDDGTMGEDGDGPEGRINAWPLGEALIDYTANQVDGDADAEDPTSRSGVQNNIIADTENFPTIDKSVLLNVAGDETLAGDERNVVTGYHAIEFLLWGQDLNEDGSSGIGGRDATAGQRPYTDFMASPGNCTSGDISADEAICQRRGDFLLAAVELLIDDLSAVTAAWNPTVNGNHYASFTAGGESSLARIVESMGRLGFGELAGERMNIALLNDSQEDEHSCFSDNTHRDIYLNAKGIQNTYRGEYQRIDGTLISGAGIDDLLISKGHIGLENQLRGDYEKTMIRVLVIDQEAKNGIPFDNQLQLPEKKDQIASAINALSSQTDTLENVIQILDLETGDLRQDTEEDI